MQTHGFLSEDIVAPRSRFYQGPFGRMFRNLPAWKPKGKNENERLKIFLDFLKTRLLSPILLQHLSKLEAGAYSWWGKFELSDFLKMAGGPMTKAEADAIMGI